MDIYIPTAGRGPDRQLTIAALGASVLSKHRTTLVCPPDEVAALKVFAKERGNNISVMKCPKDGIAATRQYIIDNAESYENPILMLDDDLSFWGWRSETDGKVKHLAASPSQKVAGFANFEELMFGQAHGSIGYKLFANNRPLIERNSRMLRALAYVPAVLRREKIKFTGAPVMEDFFVTLSLLQRGYACMTYNGLVQEQKGSNAAGGCSRYRTPAMQAEAAHMLKAAFPYLVTVVEKEEKEGWGGEFGNKRTDVRVKWAAAYKPRTV
jgi:hypothetical protein